MINLFSRTLDFVMMITWLSKTRYYKNDIFAKHMILKLLQKKWCRIIYEFCQNTIFEPETCEIGPKVGNRTCPDLPRPVLLSKFIIFIKSSVSLNKFNIFIKPEVYSKNLLFFIKSCVLLSKFTKTSLYRKTTFLFLVFQILRLLYVY